MAKEYKIKTLDDILKIPSERIDDMFSELVPRIKQMSEMRETILKIISDETVVDEMISLREMVWIDDGETNIETNITINGNKLKGEKE